MGDVIKESDYPDMLKHINAELYPLYPVPKYFSNEDLIKIFNLVDVRPARVSEVFPLTGRRVLLCVGLFPTGAA